jgi:hypothetical protein
MINVTEKTLVNALEGLIERVKKSSSIRMANIKFDRHKLNRSMSDITHSEWETITLEMNLRDPRPEKKVKVGIDLSDIAEENVENILDSVREALCECGVKFHIGIIEEDV